MNLHAIVRGAVTAINPDASGRVYISTGQATGANGKRVPTYDRIDGVPMQVQPLSMQDVGRLQQMDGLNIEGVMRSVYINGAPKGADRVEMKGGDILYLIGHFWLVVAVLEPWDTAGWAKVGVSKQINAPEGVTV
jgi:hypothetical protein